jgi:hypothetical protein
MWFLSPDADMTNLVTLCNLTSKSEVERYCRSLIIDQGDFVNFIMYARAGVFEPYKYACAFRDRQPPHLIPTAEEHEALGSNGVGLLQGKAKKAIGKMSQMLRDRRHLAAHLFYTSGLAHWSLFYFDQRDVQERDNHWEHGPHLHFLSSAWISFDARVVFEQVTDGKGQFPAVHIRYSGRSERAARRPGMTARRITAPGSWAGGGRPSP